MAIQMISEEIMVREIAADLRIGFDHAKEKATTASILGFGVLTDDTGIMFTPVVGADRGQYTDFPPDDVQFLPTHWDLGASDEILARGSKHLLDLYEYCSDSENDEAWHEQFRSRVYQILVRSLELLKADGYFVQSADREPFVIVWVVDSSVPGVRARSWSRRLNSTEMHQKFVGWMDLRWGHV